MITRTRSCTMQAVIFTFSSANTSFSAAGVTNWRVGGVGREDGTGMGGWGARHWREDGKKTRAHTGLD